MQTLRLAVERAPENSMAHAMLGYGLFRLADYQATAMPPAIDTFVHCNLGQPFVFSGIALELLQGRALQYNSAPFDELAIGQLVLYFPNVALIAQLY